MPDADARPLVPARIGLRARLADLAGFMVRATPGSGPPGWSTALLAVLALVFALDLTIGWLAGEALAVLEGDGKGGGILPVPREQDTTLAEDLFSFLVLAPLLEELLYRGWLAGRVAALRFAAYGFAAEALFIAALFLDQSAARIVGLVAVGVVLAGLLQWLATRDRDTQVPRWFTRNFHWFVWGSSLLFGLMHLGNYEAVTHPLGILVVLPHIIGGLLLAYTRTRLGLGAAIAQHAVYNAVVLAALYGAA
ncbi:CPBP family intramembrane metalloprotease [Erythrobacter sp. NFXS35]|uniref:CPBP family glutamic-type intramembrane protease n=1 Tax=Erythrobacter sp. NFXS35 TaxID=2818436 RepID=UPI0032DEB66C